MKMHGAPPRASRNDDAQNVIAPMQSADAAQYSERLKSPATAAKMAAPTLHTSKTEGKSFGMKLGKKLNP
jgi:hypothetical protein